MGINSEPLYPKDRFEELWAEQIANKGRGRESFNSNANVIPERDLGLKGRFEDGFGKDSSDWNRQRAELRNQLTQWKKDANCGK